MYILCPNVSHLYDEVVANKNYTYAQINARPMPYGDKIYAGYVHTLRDGSAILITDELFTYMINPYHVEQYHLKTGDYLRTKVAYDPQFGADVVIEICEFTKVDYDDAKVCYTDQAYHIKGTNVRYGTTAMYHDDMKLDTHEIYHHIINDLPVDTQTVVLSFDGRQENFNDTAPLYVTKPSQDSRDKLSVCLLAFFHAKQLADSGKNVVLIIDSLDKMFTVFNNCMQRNGIIQPDEISERAVMDLESILCCTANLQDRGSLTILGLYRQSSIYGNNYITNRFHQLFDKII